MAAVVSPLLSLEKKYRVYPVISIGRKRSSRVLMRAEAIDRCRLGIEGLLRYLGSWGANRHVPVQIRSLYLDIDVPRHVPGVRRGEREEPTEAGFERRELLRNKFTSIGKTVLRKTTPSVANHLIFGHHQRSCERQLSEWWSSMTMKMPKVWSTCLLFPNSPTCFIKLAFPKETNFFWKSTSWRKLGLRRFLKDVRLLSLLYFILLRKLKTFAFWEKLASRRKLKIFAFSKKPYGW